MIDTASAANVLLAARATGCTPAELPPSARPANDADAYAIQDAQMRTLGPIGGWKVGAPGSTATPNCAPLPKSLILPSPQTFAPGQFPLQLVEAEIGFTMGRDLPPRGRPYTEPEVLDAVASVGATIEILASRYADQRTVDTPSKLADFLSNGALVVGPGRTSDLRIDQTRIRLEVFTNENLAIEVTGGNSAGDVVRLLVWLANHAAERCGGLKAGEVITTGSCIGGYAVAPGTTVRAVFEGLAPVQATV